MQIEQFVPWKDELSYLQFASHTSIISRELISNNLRDQGIDVPEGTKKSKSRNDGGEEEEEGNDKFSKRKRILDSKGNTRVAVLNQEFDYGLEDGEVPLKRVQIESLDFDWLFEGQNAATLLKILAQDANQECFTKKSISVFIDLMWSKYQSAIIYRIFMPYVIYLTTLCYITASVDGRFMRSAADL